MPAPITTALQSTMPVEKVNFKILQYHEIKREEEPKRRPNNLQHLTFEDKNSKHSTFVKELKRQA